MRVSDSERYAFETTALKKKKNLGFIVVIVH